MQIVRLIVARLSESHDELFWTLVTWSCAHRQPYKRIVLQSLRFLANANACSLRFKTRTEQRGKNTPKPKSVLAPRLLENVQYGNIFHHVSFDCGLRSTKSAAGGAPYNSTSFITTSRFGAKCVTVLYSS
eukprot:6389930-Amphidinium_carterae.1